MTDAAAPTPATRDIQTLDELSHPQAQAVLDLLADAAGADEQLAVSEQHRRYLRAGRRDGERHVVLHGVTRRKWRVGRGRPR